MKATRSFRMKICSDPLQGISFCSLVIFLLHLFIIISCQPLEPVVIPQETPFRGLWTGNTSQMTYIELEVRDIDNRQVLYKLKLNYLLDSAFKQQTVFSENGIFWIGEDQFSVDLPDGSDISGKFQSQNHLSGTIRIVEENLTFREISYSATHEDSAVTINSLSRTSFRLPDTSYVYLQTADDLFPHTNNLSTDSGYFVGASVNFEKGQYNGQPVFAINVGPFIDLTEISGYFVPGNKSYAGNEGGGVEILFFDPRIYYYRLASTNWNAEQDGSYFSIIETQPVPSDIPGISRLKIMAEFGCYVYGDWGETLQISDGFFLGFVDLPSGK